MFDDVLQVVRRAAAPKDWHRGLLRARAGEVEVVGCAADGWTFRVGAETVRWAWQAWACSCGAELCEHAAASALALATAGALLRRAGGQIRRTFDRTIRLRNVGGRVYLQVVAHEEDAAGKPRELLLRGDPDAADRLVAALPSGAMTLPVTADNVALVVDEAAQALDVTLDGEPVRVDRSPTQARRAAPQVAIDGARWTRQFPGSGLALCNGEVLRPIELVDGPAEASGASGPSGSGAGAESKPAEVDPDRQELEPRWDGGGDGTVMFQAPGSEGQGAEVAAETVVRAWRSGTLALEMKDGGLAWLPRDWLQRYGPALEQFVQAKTAAAGLPRWARPAAATLCEALGEAPPAGFEGLAALARDVSELPTATLPADLTAELRDYQKRGVDWLCLLRDAGIGALLADDMGLGKTLQTLCALKGRALVVAPTSTLHNWAAELAKFRPSLKVATYHGPKRAIDRAADVTLTSYAVLRLDREQLSQGTWDAVVLDEAQAIKEPTTATAAAAFALKASWRVALSGTPVQNNLTELWSLCHFLNPGLLGGLKEFQNRYARAIDAGQTRAASELQAKLRPFVLRRRKSEVARELPPRTEIVLHCTLDADERKVYDALRLAAQTELLPKLSSGRDLVEALEMLLRMRQAACHVGLVPGQQATRSSKIDLLLQQLGQVIEGGHRALVFSQWTSLLDLVEKALATAKIEHVRLDGSTEDRAGVVGKFQAEDGPPVMLISLKAGGTGLNLTAADYVYLLDPWYNPAVEDQAADRAHRIGQVRPVFIHRLVAEDTVEEKILEMHARKRALMASAIDEVHAAGLTREDILELLG